MIFFSQRQPKKGKGTNLGLENPSYVPRTTEGSDQQNRYHQAERIDLSPKIIHADIFAIWLGKA